MKTQQLRAGDVILFRINWDAYQHSAIVVSPGTVVHADSEFVRIEPVADLARFCPEYGNSRIQPFVYRCKSRLAPGLPETAARYALHFGRNDIRENGVTLYGANRARGVTQQLKGDKNPPFEFDAIYRALKWAVGGARGGAQFSNTQGTTCAAFVIACYQAAGICEIGSGDTQEIETCLDLVKGWRVDKRSTKVDRWKMKEVRTGSGPKMVTDAYTRRVSNVGVDRESADWAAKLTDADIGSETWAYVHEVLRPGGDVFAPEHWLTRAMTVDAKFVFTQTLKERIAGDPSWIKQGMLDLA